MWIPALIPNWLLRELTRTRPSSADGKLKRTSTFSFSIMSPAHTTSEEAAGKLINAKGWSWRRVGLLLAIQAGHSERAG